MPEAARTSTTRRDVLKAAPAVLALPHAPEAAPDPLVELERRLIEADRHANELYWQAEQKGRTACEACGMRAEVRGATDAASAIDDEIALTIPASLEGLAVKLRLLMRGISWGQTGREEMHGYTALLALERMLGHDQMPEMLTGDPHLAADLAAALAEGRPTLEI